jgi:hypothetical protein
MQLWDQWSLIYQRLLDDIYLKWATFVKAIPVFVGQENAQLNARRVAGRMLKGHLVCSNLDLLLFGTLFSSPVPRPNVEDDACLCDHAHHGHRDSRVTTKDSSPAFWSIWVWGASCGCWSPGACESWCAYRYPCLEHSWATTRWSCRACVEA